MVNNMVHYTLPQEIEVWYVIPAIRRELAGFLTKKHGLSYDKAANALGITKAAISQYNNNKRAGKVKLHPRVYKEVEKSANKIFKNKEKTVKEILRVLKFMRDKKLSFKYCGEGAKNQADCDGVVLTYEKYWHN
jgi:hypothetical protein